MSLIKYKLSCSGCLWTFAFLKCSNQVWKSFPFKCCNIQVGRSRIHVVSLAAGCRGHGQTCKSEIENRNKWNNIIMTYDVNLNYLLIFASVSSYNCIYEMSLQWTNVRANCWTWLVSVLFCWVSIELNTFRDISTFSGAASALGTRGKISRPSNEC